MLGLVDGNNFYASCERVFDPRLIGKSVVVASNNDGCAIARSAEAKALGIKMGQPLHEIPPHIRRQTIIRSANFGLYGDLSARVVSILSDLFPRVEVYSIDESFIDLNGVPDIENACAEARRRILKWTGIPCCVGIGNTKTRAKAGNKMAKKTPHGVTVATNQNLANFPVEDVWGVGPRFARRLGEEGILTAGDLMRADPSTIRSRYGVVLQRTQAELNGEQCADLEEVEPQRKQIVVSRSFGQEVRDLVDLQEAVSTFTPRACEKLRARSLKAGGVWVWFNTNPFKPGAPQYNPSQAIDFPVATSDTRAVLQISMALCNRMYKQGYAFKKAGVGLLDLMDQDVVQSDLFAAPDEPRVSKGMAVMDQINQKYGRGTLGLASSGWRTTPMWGMRQESLSKAYTTRWNELMVVR